ETIAVSGTNSSRPHGVPRDVKLEKGFFTMDFGARVDGYCSDMTRTVVLGKADADMKKLYNTVLSAQLAALEAIHEGAENAKIDKIARDIIDNAGYKGCFGHGLGHGVGLYIHESPRVSSGVKEGTTLAVGNVVTVEPGIYIEGKYGCRIEDMVAVTKDGIRNFTQSPKELIELF
ncbi:MAG: M24 family metallopeptidase, partial [Clostridia bacterium]|nr:M24 family metallopeptidase [Clostridia bacterium]